MLIAMYAAAVGATFLRGWHEDDKQLFRHVRQAVRLATLPMMRLWDIYTLEACWPSSQEASADVWATLRVRGF